MTQSRRSWIFAIAFWLLFLISVGLKFRFQIWVSALTLLIPWSRTHRLGNILETVGNIHNPLGYIRCHALGISV
jgi:hypothetical protein